nr:hypothetical protein [Pseudoroseomonas aestuarii]
MAWIQISRPPLGPAPELGRLVLAVAQRLPEGLVGGQALLLRVHEHGVVLAHDLVQPVARGGEEIFVRGEHLARQVELDDGAGAVDGGDLPRMVRREHLAGRDVGGELHDARRPAAAVEHRAVGSLDPDLAPALGDPPELGALEAARPQLPPEQLVGGVRLRARLHEHAVRPAANLLDRVAHGPQEQVVGPEDGAVELEFDHRLAGLDGGHAGRRAGGEGGADRIEHGYLGGEKVARGYARGR